MRRLEVQFLLSARMFSNNLGRCLLAHLVLVRIAAQFSWKSGAEENPFGALGKPIRSLIVVAISDRSQAFAGKIEHNQNQTRNITCESTLAQRIVERREA